MLGFLLMFPIQSISIDIFLNILSFNGFPARNKSNVYSGNKYILSMLILDYGIR